MHEKVYDRFLRTFTEKAKQLKVGDPFEPDTYQGPQINETQFNVGACGFKVLARALLDCINLGF